MVERQSLVDLTDREKKDDHNKWKRERRGKLEYDKEIKEIEENDRYNDKEYWVGKPGVKVVEGKGKGKAKSNEEMNSSEHLPDSPGDSNSEDEMSRAMEESRREYRDN